jgi:DNA-binding MarR family transcriptional regulator
MTKPAAPADPPPGLEQMLVLFDELAQRLATFESGPKEFDTGVLLYRSETHLLQAIGRDPSTNVTRLAERLGVTKGAVSQTLAKLVRKKLVRKRTAPASGREIVLELTALGWKGYNAHERFHAEAFDAARAYFRDDLEVRVAATCRALVDLIGMFDVFDRRAQAADAVTAPRRAPTTSRARASKR